MEKTVKEFNKDEHKVCPRCGFEVVRIFRQGTRNAYVFRDGSIDMDTRQVDKDPNKTDRNICNSIKCDWMELV